MALIMKGANLSTVLFKRNLKKVLYHGYKTANGNHDQCNGNRKRRNISYLGIGAGVIGLFFYNYYRKQNNNKPLLRATIQEDAGYFIKELPSYTLDEVNKHSTIDARVWVTYKQGVYDITEFISQHPGGDQIMMAAGSSVEPFWLLYGVHKTPQIFQMLEAMRIGNLSEEDADDAIKDMDDPYANEPIRHKILRAAALKPFNAEAPTSLLVDNFNTPNEIFYVRNHLPVPEVDSETYELEIEIEGVDRTKVLTLSDIKKLPKYSVSAAVMCAGNRRNEMHEINEVKGLSWSAGAIGNAEWSGARLVDVLKMMGIDENSEGFKHVHFEGLDSDTTNVPYSASIPIYKAVDKYGDVLLAYEMNGQPLPRDHGFPIRVLVPGTVGARNVKWLGRIVVSENECESHWQQADYKGCSPSTTAQNVDWSSLPAIQALPVISAICKPSYGQTVQVEDGYINVKGYAWSGGGNKIVRVDVTVDAGKYWYTANVDHQDKADPPRHWSWTLWSAKVPVPKELQTVEIWAKAVDSSYNCQPDSVQNIWNFRGVLNNAFHRIKVNLKH